MSDAWDDEDRAIARALDAIESPDRDTADQDTAGQATAGEHAADEDLLDEYRDVLAHLAVADVTPRPELEDQIVAAALARRPAAVPSIERARAGARRPRRVQVAVLAVATIAAAIVIGVIVHTGPTQSAPAAHLNLATTQHVDVDALLGASGSRSGVLAKSGRVVVDPDGNGAVYAISAKDPLSIGLVSKAGTTTIGPAQPTNGIIAFVVDHPERLNAVELLRNGVVVATATLTSH